MARIRTGIYHHFKGGDYRVIGLARHSESLEELVVYRHLDGKELWARPKSLFFGYKNVRGKRLKRFTYIGIRKRAK